MVSIASTGEQPERSNRGGRTAAAPRQTTACLLIIGNEILSGRTQDANLSVLGKRCDALGIRLAEARVIPDIEECIVDAVNACRAAFDYVFTTGGIGPTHDDITAAAVARAFGVTLERNAQASAALGQYYEEGQLTAPRLKMADVPVGAVLVENPLSGAPGFKLENVFVLAGVPRVFAAMLDGLGDRLAQGAPIITTGVATNLAESVIAGGLGALQQQYPDIDMGSYPRLRNGRAEVSLVLRGTDSGRLRQAQDALVRMLGDLGGELIDAAALDEEHE